MDARDRGVHYGDGVFETMRVRRHAIRLLEFHLERLTSACGRLGFTAPPLARLRGELSRAAALRADAVLKLIVTRGVGPRGYRPSGVERCTRMLYLHPLPRSALKHPPARVRLCRLRLAASPALAGLKSLNRLESVLARAEWHDPAIWEGLLRDTEDRIVCGTMTNVFLKRGARLLTPRVDRCGIAGVMRRWVLASAARLGLEAEEADVHWRDMAAADEIFLTNAVVGIVPVARVDNGRASLVLTASDTARGLADLLEVQ